jgi:hypothetical protein
LQFKIRIAHLKILYDSTKNKASVEAGGFEVYKTYDKAKIIKLG